MKGATRIERPSTGRARGRPATGRATNLSREAIVQVVCALVRHEGIGAITVRGVAREMGVSPRLLYAHIRDQQELVELFCDALFTEYAPDLTSPDWEARLRAIAEANNRALAPYPGLAAQLLARSIEAIAQPRASLLQQAMRTALADAGLNGELLEQFYFQFVVAVLGNIILAENFASVADLDAKRSLVKRSQSLGLDLLFSSIRMAVQNPGCRSRG